VLAKVVIENFRRIETAELTFDPRGTGILGNNAAGKTSLLEAIFFLSHARSFRTNDRNKLVRTGSKFFRVVGDVESTRGRLTAGSEYTHGKTTTRLAGDAISSIAEIAEILPIQLIDPGVHRLIEEGSSRRRRLMDWGVFHVKHEFLHFWRRYQRTVRQRNAALRSGEAASLVSAWEPELVECGAVLDQARAEYIASLQPMFAELSGQLLDEPAQLEYRRGWADDISLAQAFEEARSRDQRLKTSTVGPHRADVSFHLRGRAARDVVSRGQQKLLASAFILAQIRLRSLDATTPTCLLLDDPAAELDVDNLGKLLRVIDAVPSQLIVTSVSEAGLQGMHIGRKFHVEQGRFTPML
jgi:DNA replication and repair protein RecF